MNQLLFSKNDGGRADAGYKGKRVADCTPRAIAIATGMGYRETRAILDELNAEMTGGLESSTQNGTPSPVSHRYLTDEGWTLTVTRNEKKYLNDVPQDRIVIAVLSRHVVTVIHGTVHDTWDSRVSRKTRNGSPRLLGYYSQRRGSYGHWR
tara:strand:+ start:88 stop:540 length:453 start_codon:yes stop_codon:yes gene_type:complete